MTITLIGLPFSLSVCGSYGRIETLISLKTSPLPPLPLFKVAYSKVVEFYLLKAHSIPNTSRSIMVRWIPPPRNFFKLNTDGSSFENPGKEGIGGVIRNSNGNWVLGFS